MSTTTTMASTAPPPPTPTPPTITINDHSSNPDNNLYDITFLSPTTTTTITTTVTSDPTVVTSWITTFLSSSVSHLFGLDIEWRPNRSRNHDNPVATLQLCTSTSTTTHACLIFQIIHCPPPLPDALTTLLASEKFSFAGVGIASDVEKLIVDYDLSVLNVVELGELAKEKKAGGFRPHSNLVGLKDLTKAVLGVEVNKPKSVTMSRWDQGWLSYPQIQYACVDAFLSFEIGSKLLALPSPSSV